MTRRCATCGVRPNPVDLALQYTSDLAVDELASAVDARRQALAAQLAMLEQERRTAVLICAGGLTARC